MRSLLYLLARLVGDLTALRRGALGRRLHLGPQVALAIALLALGACESPGGVLVSQAEFAGTWPFTVTSGRLECTPMQAVVFHVNDDTYAINGTATASAQREGWMPAEEIWAIDTERLKLIRRLGNTTTTPRVSIGDMIDEGLKLCDGS